jgi:hypothetical protein
VGKRGRPKKITTFEAIADENSFIAIEYDFGVDSGYYTKELQAGYFNNLKDLLKLPWIKSYKNYGKFSISKKPTFNWLMVTNEYGTVWWILAILPKNFECDLPEFKIHWNAKPPIE